VAARSARAGLSTGYLRIPGKGGTVTFDWSVLRARNQSTADEGEIHVGYDNDG
jgi:hypothetical protein